MNHSARWLQQHRSTKAIAAHAPHASIPGGRFCARFARRLGRPMLALLMLLPAPWTYAETRGGSVTVGVEQDMPGFDPLVVGIYDTGTLAASALLFDTLTRLDDNGTAQPRLALSWSNSPDFKTWTFKLRPGVKFHDGTPFNAQAVAFNYRRMIDPDNRCRCAAYLTGIRRVEAKDELTVIFHLRNPAVSLPALLSPPTVTNVIHSPTAIEKAGKDYNRQPVGTGPFRLKSWRSGDRIVLERNPAYWNAGHPYLDQAIIRPLPDPSTRFASLLAGDVDIIWHDRGDDIAKAMQNSALTVHRYTGTAVSAIVFNTSKPPLNDVRVRQALRHALDMDNIIGSITRGTSKGAKTPYGAGSFVQCPGVEPLKYDPAKAKALLAEYGKPVNLKYMVTAEPRGRMNGQIFQQYWKAAGINVTLDEADQTTFVAKSFQRDFEIGGWRIIDLADPDPQMTSNFRTGSPVNIANYSNPEVDTLLDRARATSDQKARVADYCKIAEILNRDVPWIWAANATYHSIAKPQLKGVHKQYSDVIDVSDAWWDKK
ncbi:MAG: ABC transporter substrate-binding protein [Sulfurifustis sp.]